MRSPPPGFRGSVRIGKKMKPLPFKIDRTSRTSLIRQMTAGISAAIRCGAYKGGEMLPTIAELSAAAGVSQIVTRAALKRLRDEGLVNSRPFHGTVILGSRRSLNKGEVVIVTTELRDTFIVATISAVLREALMKAGYMTTHVSVVKGADNKPDFTQLDAMLDQPVKMAVVLLDRWGVGTHIARKKRTPLVVFGREPVKGAKGHIRFLPNAGIPDFIAHCCARGVDRITHVTTSVNGVKIDDSVFEKAGIAVDKITFDPFGSLDAVEMAVMGACSVFERLLAGKGRSELPELLYFSDDYIFSGALIALMHHGIRIPEDVNVVTLAHRGNGPFYWKPLTRMELDPYEGGRSVANFVLLALSGKRIPADAAVRSVYRIGDTFPA